eukprot:4945286-Prymnesium_polylepis.2
MLVHVRERVRQSDKPDNRSENPGFRAFEFHQYAVVVVLRVNVAFGTAAARGRCRARARGTWSRPSLRP